MADVPLVSQQQHMLDTTSRLEEDVRGYIEKIKEEQSRLLASIEYVPLGFLIIDIKNNILIKNKALDKILGLQDLEGSILLRGDIVNIEERLTPHFDLRTVCDTCIKEKKAVEFAEVPFETKFLKIFVTPILVRSPEEKITGVTVLIEDITEAKVIERSREEFFAVASHELRTPLTAIRGNAEMLQDIYKDKMADKDMADMITDIHDASVRLIGIVNDFLDTSRLEQGKALFKKEPVDLLPIIRETCKEIEPLAKAKNLLLLFTEPVEAPPPVLADQVRMKEAISNLIDNAVKYTEKGSVTVTLERTGSSLAVSVTDTGKGISPQNQALLFRKFQQAGEAMLTRDVSKSTGLGLYITKLVVEGMGGTIMLAKSALGEGSTFRLTMPLAL